MADFTDVQPPTPGALGLAVLLAWNDQPVWNSSEASVLTPGPLGLVVLLTWNDQAPSDVQAEMEFSAFQASDSSIPSLANFSPAGGTTLAKYDPIAFDVTDTGDFQASMHISVYIVATDTTEMAWGGEDNVGQPVWENQYNTSTRSAISGGYHFIIRRRGGWPSGGVRIKVRAVDRGGNVGTI